MANQVTTAAAQLIYSPVGQPAGLTVQITALSGGMHYVGPAGVTPSTGVPMGPGDTMTLHSPAALYAINGSSGTLDVRVIR